MLLYTWLIGACSQLNALINIRLLLYSIAPSIQQYNTVHTLPWRANKEDYGNTVHTLPWRANIEDYGQSIAPFLQQYNTVHTPQRRANKEDYGQRIAPFLP